MCGGSTDHKHPAPEFPAGTLTAADRTLARSAAATLSRAFTWYETDEGYAYWHGVYVKLHALAAGRLLKPVEAIAPAKRKVVKRKTVAKKK